MRALHLHRTFGSSEIPRFASLTPHVVANAPETVESRARMLPSMNDTDEVLKDELTDRGMLP